MGAAFERQSDSTTMERKASEDLKEARDLLVSRFGDMSIVPNWVSLPRTPRHWNNPIPVPRDDLVGVVKGLKTPLFIHQRAAVKAMTDLERLKKLKVKDWYQSDKHLSIDVREAIYSDPVGSGKTISLLACILHSELRNRKKIIMKVPCVLTGMNLFPRSDTCYGLITYDLKPKILPQTLIVVNTSVFKQWQTEIAKHTNLTWTSVGDIRQLRNLIIGILNGSLALSKIQLVVMKCGRISKDFEELKCPIVKKSLCDFPTEHDQAALSALNQKIKYERNMMHILSQVNCHWLRVIYDDFDTLTLRRRLSASFSWHVSATPSCKWLKSDMDKYDPLDMPLTVPSGGCANMVRIQNDKDFIEMRPVEPIMHFYSFKDMNWFRIIGRFSLAMRDMLVQDALDLNRKSIAEIFKDLLGEKYNEFLEAKQLVEFVEEQLGIERPNLEEGEHYNYSREDLLQREPPEFEFPGLKDLLKVALNEQRARKEDASKLLNRVKENIVNECLVCFDSIKDKDTHIFVCCGVTLCDPCAQRIFEQKRCPHCRGNDPKTILINANFDIDAILNENFAYSYTNNTMSKFAQLVNLVGGAEVTVDHEQWPIDEPGAKKEAKQEAKQKAKASSSSSSSNSAKIRKFLVFAYHEVCINRIARDLDAAKIPYLILNGSYGHISNIVELFKEADQIPVLLINSFKYCSGLNLQFATDIVFMHALDLDQETQVIGRGQRIGRTSVLSIHYFLYETEKKMDDGPYKRTFGPLSRMQH